MKSAADVIGIEQIRALREAGFVVVHQAPTESMVKAGFSVGKYHYHGPDEYWHRMVAESIRLQNSEEAPKGCKKRLASGQWFSFCGETDMGQTAPALCTECGGSLKLDN